MDGSALRRSASTLLFVAAWFACIPACRRAQAPSSAVTTPGVTALDATYGALRADFARDAGHPRVLVVASPT